MKKITLLKILGILCILGILISCGNKSAEKSQKEEKPKEPIPVMVKVKRMYFDYMTPIRIDCDKFDEWVENDDSFTIENKDTINLFIETLKDLEKISPNYFIDVRAKLLIFYQNHPVDTVCIDRSIVSINGEIYRNNKKLIDLIEGL